METLTNNENQIKRGIRKVIIVLMLFALLLLAGFVLAFSVNNVIGHLPLTGGNLELQVEAPLLADENDATDDNLVVTDNVGTMKSDSTITRQYVVSLTDTSNVPCYIRLKSEILTEQQNVIQGDFIYTLSEPSMSRDEEENFITLYNDKMEFLYSAEIDTKTYTASFKDITLHLGETYKVYRVDSLETEFALDVTLFEDFSDGYNGNGIAFTPSATQPDPETISQLLTKQNYTETDTGEQWIAKPDGYVYYTGIVFPQGTNQNSFNGLNAITTERYNATYITNFSVNDTIQQDDWKLAFDNAANSENQKIKVKENVVVEAVQAQHVTVDFNSDKPWGDIEPESTSTL